MSVSGEPPGDFQRVAKAEDHHPTGYPATFQQRKLLVNRTWFPWEQVAGQRGLSEHTER